MPVLCGQEGLCRFIFRCGESGYPHATTSAQAPLQHAEEGACYAPAAVLFGNGKGVEVSRGAVEAGHDGGDDFAAGYCDEEQTWRSFEQPRDFDCVGRYATCRVCLAEKVENGRDVVRVGNVTDADARDAELLGRRWRGFERGQAV